MTINITFVILKKGGQVGMEIPVQVSRRFALLSHNCCFRRTFYETSTTTCQQNTVPDLVPLAHLCTTPTLQAHDKTRKTSGGPKYCQNINHYFSVFDDVPFCTL